MASTEQELFGLRSMNGKVELFGRDAIRTNVFTSVFERGRTLTAEDGTLEWDEMSFSRSLAPVVGSMSQFPLRQNLAKTVRRSAVMHIKEARLLDPNKLYYERAAGSLRPNAAAYVEQEMRDTVMRIQRTIEYACSQSLIGTFTCNSSNIPGTTVPFTLTYSPNTYTKSAGWATAGTGILSSEIPLLKQDFTQTCGLEPKQAIVGSTIEGYFTGNTEVTNFIQRIDNGARVLNNAGTLEGPMFGGLEIGGLAWTITEGGYVPDGGSFTRYLATTDQAIVLPSNGDLVDVVGMGLGRGFVPQADIASVEQAANLIQPAPQAGWYAYATREKNPMAVQIHVGWVGLPVVLRPDAVSVADCN